MLGWEAIKFGKFPPSSEHVDTSLSHTDTLNGLVGPPPTIISINYSNQFD